MKENKLRFEYYFIRHPIYNEALKEAGRMEETGWRLCKWHYEATTLTFVLTMRRPAIKKEPEVAPQEEESKPWRRKIKKRSKSES